MRLPDGTKIGELDEEFVFERRTGDSFDFGSRSWRITDIGSEAVTVEALGEAADFQPFWRAEAVFRSSELCHRTLDFFDAWNNKAELSNRDVLGEEAAAALEDLLSRQQKAQGGVPLPDHATIPVEIIDDPAVRPDAFRIVFHSFRGGALNYPLAMALSSVLEEKTGMRCEAVPDDNAILVQLPRLAAESYSGRPDPEALVKACIAPLGSSGETYFKKRLEASGIFGAAFREAAERSLVLPRGMFGKRVPLWVMRQRAKRLFDRAAAFDDFPLITEAWRSCLADEFDMEGFRALLDDLVSGAVQLRFFHSYAASPFARDLSWKETNSFMYEYDERSDILGIPAGSGAAGGLAARTGGTLADKALGDALADPSLRPVIPSHVHDAFTARQRRELPGYAPEDPLGLAQWVKDRVAIPLNDEWKTLCAVLPEDLGIELESDPTLGGRIAVITLPGAAVPVVVHAETAAELQSLSDITERLSYLAQWMRFEGLITSARAADIFGCTKVEAEDSLDALVESEDAVNNIKLENSDELLFCDRENYELLLRLTRKKARPQIKERPASLLVPFIARRQGLIKIPAEHAEPQNWVSAYGGIVDPAFNVLSAFPAPVKFWETEIFPARIQNYRPEILDALLRDEKFVWFGAGEERAAFSSVEEFDLADTLSARVPNASKQDSSARELTSAIPELCSSYRNFWEIKDALEQRTKTSLSNGDIAAALWEAVWRGDLSSDSWESVRRGIEHGFVPGKTEAAELMGYSKLSGIVPPYRPLGRNANRRLPGALKHKWREGAPVPGRWYSLETTVSSGEYGAGELSALEEEELNCERVRLLIRRWGILCRPLLETEVLFSWSRLLPAMRRMELSGELVTGRFFAGIPSLQFASPNIAKELEAADDAANAVYWMNAADPASPAGWNIAGLDTRLPARTSSSRLCFCGKDLAAVSLKNGKELELFIPPDDSNIKNVLAFLDVPRKRTCHPLKKIALETINGKPAAETVYAPLLAELGFITDRGKMFLW
jgi:ATP-dependent Lhr-like helicase